LRIHITLAYANFHGIVIIMNIDIHYLPCIVDLSKKLSTEQYVYRVIPFTKIIAIVVAVIISLVNYQVGVAAPPRSIPVVAPDIAVGTDFSCALTATGDVWCWGDHSYGQLGIGTTTMSNVPVQVTGLSNVQSMSAGSTHVCAIDASNALWCWGHNDHGQVGTGDSIDATSPTQVSGTDLSSDVVQVSAGATTTCAVKVDNSLYCWGQAAPVLGMSGAVSDILVPTLSNSISDIRSISIGTTHACIVQIGGLVQCWGSNQYGQFGDAVQCYMTTLSCLQRVKCD
jgi:alpha-tubulin suppressor-like RCC1 family protein